MSGRTPIHYGRISGIALVGAAVLAIATSVQLGRQVGSPAVDTIWAEDGRVFLGDALSQGVAATVEPYRGYMHLVSRLIGLLAATLPLALAAVVFAVASAILVALLAFFVFFAAKESIPSVSARLLLSSFMVVVPQGWLETSNNGANLHWFLLFAGYWAVAGSPNVGAGTRYLVAGLAALSDPLAALLLPTAVLRTKKENLVQRKLLFVIAVGVAVQLFVFFFLAGDVPPESNSSFLDVPRLYAIRVAASFFLGDRLLGGLWPHVGWALGLAAVVVILVLVFLGLRSRGPERGMPGLECVVLSAGFFSAAALIRGTASMLPSDEEMSFSASRFVVISVLFLAAGLLVLYGAPPHHHFSALAGRAVVFGVLLVTAISDFRIANPRSLGPRWSTELVAARARCGERQPRAVSVQVTPTGPAAYWRVRVPCARLSSVEAGMEALPAVSIMQLRLRPDNPLSPTTLCV